MRPNVSVLEPLTPLVQIRITPCCGITSLNQSWSVPESRRPLCVVVVKPDCDCARAAESGQSSEVEVTGSMNWRIWGCTLENRVYNARFAVAHVALAAPALSAPRYLPSGASSGEPLLPPSVTPADHSTMSAAMVQVLVP